MEKLFEFSRGSYDKVSHHLAVLRYAGLVKDRRDGLWIYYSLTEPRNKVEENLFECLRECLRKDKSFRADLANMKKCIAQSLDVIAEMVRMGLPLEGVKVKEISDLK